MDEAKLIVRLKIEQFEQLLANATDPDEREIISQLLAKQQARLLKMECKVRGG
jgi:hypothetical protein